MGKRGKKKRGRDGKQGMDGEEKGEKARRKEKGRRGRQAIIPEHFFHFEPVASFRRGELRTVIIFFPVNRTFKTVITAARTIRYVN